MYMSNQGGGVRMVRIAEAGDYLLNIDTEEILTAKLVFDNGTAIVKEEMHLFDDSPEITQWDRFEYIVLIKAKEIKVLLEEERKKRVEDYSF
jgi:hypothetical protein